LFILAAILNVKIMKQLISIVVFLFISSFVFAQRGYYEQELEMPFQPRFTLGSGYYSSQGNIQGPDVNNLLGNIGFKAGIRMNITDNTDVSLLFTNFKLSETSTEKFNTDLQSVGIHLDYTFNHMFKEAPISPFLTLGVQRLTYKTLFWQEGSSFSSNPDIKYPTENTFAFPTGIGVAFDVSERIRIDVALSHVLTLADIDMESSNTSDNFILADFIIHYDFFTLLPPKEKIDDSYYSDVNFQALDVQDEDGDLVLDINDNCPGTPQGVDVDENGCPLDGDNDGIPNYIDKDLNTVEGALVDEHGVELTIDQYKSMYSYEVASRKYANSYNESEIKKGDYKSINEYLIAKANAFNEAYNNVDSEVQGLRYKVQIAKYNDAISDEMQVKLLSIIDLETFAKEDGYIIYSVGSYSTLEEALSRSDELEYQGFNDIYYLVDNNGVISDYVPPVIEAAIEEEKNVNIDTSSNVQEGNKVLPVDTLPIYRIQIGAFNEILPQEIFTGVDNVIHMKDADGFIKYLTGSFSDKRKAIDYMFQMRARGFEDAFVVGFNQGVRTIEFFAPVKNQVQEEKIDWATVVQNPEKEEEVIDNKKDVQFFVQIFVGKELLGADDLKKMTELGNIDKEPRGSDMYVYLAGVYSSFNQANTRLSQATSVGFGDSFIYAELDGERIPLTVAKTLDND
jgi:opacity protein-like surface antigen